MELDFRRDQSGDPRGPAWAVTRNPRVVVATLNHWCRPDRNHEWEQQRRQDIGDLAFERQFGRNWSTPAGAVWYPEVASQVAEPKPWQFEGWYVRKAQGVLDAPMVRGWDFGQRPAMVLGQWSRAQGLLWVYRELRLEHMLVHDFFALGRYLCGQATLEELKNERRFAALAWIERERREGFYGVPMPWLRPGARFIDFCAKHEGNMGNCLAPTEETRTCVMAAGQQGLTIRGIKTGWNDRDITMRFLLREGAVQGYPRLLIDPACKWLLKGMSGGLQRPTRGQMQGGPKRDRIYEDVHDALTYAAAGMCPLRLIPALEKQAKVGLTATVLPPRHKDTYQRVARKAPRETHSWARAHYAGA